jgi:hypothetical protein
MASIRKEILTSATPADAWAAIRDIGALHTRLVPPIPKFASLGDTLWCELRRALDPSQRVGSSLLRGRERQPGGVDLPICCRTT